MYRASTRSTPANSTLSNQPNSLPNLSKKPNGRNMVVRNDRTTEQLQQSKNVDTSSSSHISEIDSSGQYSILGLTLPRPPPELREEAEAVEQDLKDLAGRNMESKLALVLFAVI